MIGGGLKHCGFLLQMTSVLFDFTPTAGHQEIQSTRDKRAAYLSRAKLAGRSSFIFYVALGLPAKITSGLCHGTYVLIFFYPDRYHRSTRPVKSIIKNN